MGNTVKRRGWTVEKAPPKRLTSDEKETVIQIDSSGEVANIYCSDKTIITKLKKIKGIKIIEESWCGCRFELPKEEITIGKPKTKRVSKTTSKKATK